MRSDHATCCGKHFALNCSLCSRPLGGRFSLLPSAILGCCQDRLVLCPKAVRVHHEALPSTRRHRHASTNQLRTFHPGYPASDELRTMERGAALETSRPGYGASASGVNSECCATRAATLSTKLQPEHVRAGRRTAKLCRNVANCCCVLGSVQWFAISRRGLADNIKRSRMGPNAPAGLPPHRQPNGLSLGMQELRESKLAVIRRAT